MAIPRPRSVRLPLPFAPPPLWGAQGDMAQRLDPAAIEQGRGSVAPMYEMPTRFYEGGYNYGSPQVVAENISGGEGSDTLAGGTRSRYSLTPEDVAAVERTSARLGVRPADLMAVIHYETIGTMNPTIKGGKGGNYQGLIQFGPRERRTYGYDKDASFAEQIEGPVYNYLKGRGLPYGASLGTIYRTVNGGNPNANLRFKDGPIVNGRRTGRTIAQHIQAITANNLPQAEMLIANVGPLGPNTEAIADVAALNPPTGAEAGMPSPLQGYQPPDAAFASPGQQAISDMLGQPGDLTADQIDELTRTDVAGNYTNPPVAPPSAPSRDFDFAAGPGPTFTPPPISRSPGPGGALGVDLGTAAGGHAGATIPSRHLRLVGRRRPRRGPGAHSRHQPAAACHGRPRRPPPATADPAADAPGGLGHS